MSRLLWASSLLLLLGLAAWARPQQEEPPDIAALLARLGSESFDERQDAERQLDALGEDALPTLRQAADDSDDPEVRHRAAGLVEAIDGRLFRELRRFE